MDSSALKSAIEAAIQYRSNKNDRNFAFLQTQIDVLIHKTNRGSCFKFFDPREIIPAKCLTTLVDIVADPKTKPALTLKCILLFNNLIQEADIQRALHEDFQLTSALASVVAYHDGSTDTFMSEVLSLLQRVSYGHRISFQETYIDHLIPFLIRNIQSPPTCLTQSSMGTLVNMTRDNFPIQSHIKNKENIHALSVTLTKVLSEGNQTTILFAVSLIASLCLEEDIGDKFFNANNVHKTFQIVFSVMCKDDSGISRMYAVDLFRDVLKIPRVMKALVKYEYLGTSIERTLCLLSKTSSETVVKVFELLLVLCSIEEVRPILCKTIVATFPLQDAEQFQNLPQNPLSKITDPLLATVYWAGQSVETHGISSLYALDLLSEIYEELVFSNSKAHCGKHTSLIMPVLVKMMKTKIEGDDSTLKRNCEKIVKCVKLLHVLCGVQEWMLSTTKYMDTSQLLSRLLEYQFTHNPIAVKSHGSSSKDDWSETGVDVVLYVLDLLNKLSQQAEELDNLCLETMQDSRIVPFLARGLTSSNRERVQVTLAILSYGASVEGFPSIILGDAVCVLNEHKSGSQTSSQLREPVFLKQPVFVEDKENRPPSPRGFVSHITNTNSTSDVSSAMENSIQSLIKKINSGLDLKDSKTSDIISVYESSIQSLQTKEEHLQDLLEAKTLALAQADRLLAQYRSRKGQDEAESKRMRATLLEYERRSESLQEKLNDLSLEKEALTKEIEELDAENQKLEQVAEVHKQLTETHTDLTKRYESVQKSLTSLKQEHHSLTEMHEMLQKHHQTLKQQHDTATEQIGQLQKERKQLSTDLKNTESKLKDVSKACSKWETECKKSEEERESLEGAVDELQKKLSKTESVKKELQTQVDTLTVLCSTKEEQLKERTDESEKLRAEIDKHRQIQALINSLSSGNTSKATNKE